jgi:hypothetical protein
VQCHDEIIQEHALDKEVFSMGTMNISEKSPADLRKEAHQGRDKTCYQAEFDYMAHVVKGIPTHVFTELIYKCATRTPQKTTEI